MLHLVFVLFGLSLAGDVIFTEVVPHSDVEDGYFDYVELHNTGKKKAIDISGWYLSDKGSNLLLCKIRPNTILQPKEYRSFAFQNDDFRGGPRFSAADLIRFGVCAARLSKSNDHVYLSIKNGTKIKVVHDVNIGGTINRVANSRWETSDDKATYPSAFPTENFENRYPIVGPWAIDKIVWMPPPGQPQYIRFKLLFGTFSWDGTARLAGHWAQPYSIRFEEQKSMFTNGVLSPTAYDLPKITLKRGQDFYLISSSDTQGFARQMGVSAEQVAGPWRGNLVNKTSGNMWLGLFMREHQGQFLIELIRWKPKKKDGWRPAKNGGIEKLSPHGVAMEPKNWIGIGDTLPCNLTNDWPKSDCPHIDMCTGHECLPDPANRGKGICRYNSMICNHRNWARCYPDNICVLPPPARYQTQPCTNGNGCRLSSCPFGHQLGDTDAWGFYTNVPGMGGSLYYEIPWYKVGCQKKKLDCDVSGWDKWSECGDCKKDQKTPCLACLMNQNRSRDAQTLPTTGPAGFVGKACPHLFESRNCNHDGKCKPCKHLKCTKPRVCWPNNQTFTATCEIPVPCVLGEWQYGECSRTCGGGRAIYWRNITKPAKFGGYCDPDQLRNIDCNTAPCPVDCKMSDWTAWSGCSHSCGGGTQTSTRKVIVEPLHGGVICPTDLRRSKKCNEELCPKDCEGSWSAWEPCDCDTQTTMQYYQVTTPNIGTGKECEVASGTIIKKACKTESCLPIDCAGVWTEWGNCTCGKRQKREFTILHDPKFGGADCPHSPIFQECEPNATTCNFGTDDNKKAFPNWAIAVTVVGGVAAVAAVLGGAAAAGGAAGGEAEAGYVMAN